MMFITLIPVYLLATLQACCSRFIEVDTSVGKTVTLPCISEHLDSVDWLYGDHYLFLEGYRVNDFTMHGERLELVTKKDEYGSYFHNLTIRDVTVGDTGLYMCVENNRQGATHYIWLNTADAVRSETHVTPRPPSFYGLVIGIPLGGVFIAGIVVVVIILCVKRYRRNNANDPADDIDQQNVELSVINGDVPQAGLSIERNSLELVFRMVHFTEIMADLCEGGVITEQERDWLFSLPDLEGKLRLLFLIAGKPKEQYDTFMQIMSDNCEELERRISVAFRHDHRIALQASSEEETRRMILLNKTTIVDHVNPLPVIPHLLRYHILTIPQCTEMLGAAPDARTRCWRMMRLLIDVDPEDFPYTHLLFTLRDPECYPNVAGIIDRTSINDAYAAHQSKMLHKQHMSSSIWAIAVMDQVVYVVLQASNVIHRYNAETYKELTPGLLVDGLEWAHDMVADAGQKCLYISDRNSSSIKGLFCIRIPESTILFKQMDEQTHVTPQGLSMSRHGKELLVVCEHPKIGSHRKQELRFLGDDEIGPFPRKEIVAKRIDLSHIEHFLLQAVELADDHFAISQVRRSQNMHRIILIDKNGKLLSSFGSAIVPENIRFPWSLHVDQNNMLIASHCDCDPDSDPNSVDNRILVLQVLDGQLEYCRDLISKHDAWMADIALYPRRLFFDEPRGIMYVASGWKGGPYARMYGNFSVWDILQLHSHTPHMSASNETIHSHIQPSVHDPSVPEPSIHEQ